MSPQASEVWFDKVAKVGAQIPGVAAGAVYAGGSGQVDGVQPMPEDIAFSALPAFVLSYQGAGVLAGSWERQTHNLEAGLWVERNPLAERYAQLIGFIDAVMATFPPRSKPDGEIESMLVTGFRRITAIDWGEAEYLVLPFSIQVVRNRAAQYVAAGP